MPDAEVGKKAPGNPLLSASDRIRESAKWLLASFAAVGVVFAAGLQLADIGDLTLEQPIRLLVALFGIVATVVSIAVAVAAAGAVVTVSHVSLSLLNSNPDYDEVKKQVNADSSLLQPAVDVEDLQNKVAAASTTADAAFVALHQAIERDAPNAERSKAEKQAALAQDKESDWCIVRDQVLSVASFLRVKNAYESARKQIVLAASGAAVGLVAFAWGANAPESTSIDAGEILPKTPSEVTVVFANADDPRARQALGRNCDLTAVAAVAVQVTGDTYQVATVKTDKCRSAWMEISPTLGSVIPRVKAAVSTDSPA